ncbi:uncharacterized protein LOC129920668 [Episyrphus balteatus]|uniref:uncharacterized protein LOC129920668 n=1 Tax=Episyrphus balteatus TaxID=286459 RepID=UPI0024868BEA|nr:uncharacterized protein LOC129920668 [Episyrphus balteatus]
MGESQGYPKLYGSPSAQSYVAPIEMPSSSTGAVQFQEGTPSFSLDFVPESRAAQSGCKWNNQTAVQCQEVTPSYPLDFEMGESQGYSKSYASPSDQLCTASIEMPYTSIGAVSLQERAPSFPYDFVPESRASSIVQPFAAQFELPSTSKGTIQALENSQTASEVNQEETFSYSCDFDFDIGEPQGYSKLCASPSGQSCTASIEMPSSSIGAEPIKGRPLSFPLDFVPESCASAMLQLFIAQKELPSISKGTTQALENSQTANQVNQEVTPSNPLDFEMGESQDYSKSYASPSDQSYIAPIEMPSSSTGPEPTQETTPSFPEMYASPTVQSGPVQMELQDTTQALENNQMASPVDQEVLPSYPLDFVNAMRESLGYPPLYASASAQSCTTSNEMPSTSIGALPFQETTPSFPEMCASPIVQPFGAQFVLPSTSKALENTQTASEINQEVTPSYPLDFDFEMGEPQGYSKLCASQSDQSGTASIEMPSSSIGAVPFLEGSPSFQSDFVPEMYSSPNVQPLAAHIEFPSTSKGTTQSLENIQRATQIDQEVLPSYPLDFVNAMREALGYPPLYGSASAQSCTTSIEMPSTSIGMPQNFQASVNNRNNYPNQPEKPSYP